MIAIRENKSNLNLYSMWVLFINWIRCHEIRKIKLDKSIDYVVRGINEFVVFLAYDPLGFYSQTKTFFFITHHWVCHGWTELWKGFL